MKIAKPRETAFLLVYKLGCGKVFEVVIPKFISLKTDINCD